MKYPMIFAILMSVLSAPVLSAVANEDARPTATEARTLYASGVVFVDVRTDEEWKVGHLKSAVHLPVSEVADQAIKKLTDKKKPIVTYCASGKRAQKAAELLRGMGYSHVTAMSGGFEDLKAAGYPIEPQ